MIAYTLRRLLQFIPTILIISLVMFILLNVLPGNAALMAGDKGRVMDQQYIDKMNRQWGLDKPLHIRYLTYVRDMAKGDLGVSFSEEKRSTPCWPPGCGPHSGWPSHR